MSLASGGALPLPASQLPAVFQLPSPPPPVQVSVAALAREDVDDIAADAATAAAVMIHARRERWRNSLLVSLFDMSLSLSKACERRAKKALDGREPDAPGVRPGSRITQESLQSIEP